MILCSLVAIGPKASAQDLEWPRFSRPRQLLSENGHRRANGSSIEDFNNVVRAHPDTTVASRFPDGAFLGSAMNIDAAVPSILVARFCTFQPKNPRHDGIASRCINENN